MDTAIDCREAARKMLQTYGGEAQRRAFTRAERLREEGDERLYSLWMAVHDAIEHLRYRGNLPGL